VLEAWKDDVGKEYDLEVKKAQRNLATLKATRIRAQVILYTVMLYCINFRALE
jgi:hypothetical protein